MDALFVEAVASNYPERFRRIREQCRYGADNVDLDLHAAKLTLLVERIRQAQAA